ncbi:hypothetical protein GCM10023115_41430 [Pontixanthobacter gangjinensis]|uniref:Uncharacterized protein n=1 Tax=Christiangramia aestuarii TaxID=1028746 RepID=A0A7K1LS82_9FLAO|nr:M64 family metallopeptidase [Christiangramia aestuarii]MUP43471.1 hypothetical protein [Christiangramia aestuarii]
MKRFFLLAVFLLSVCSCEDEIVPNLKPIEPQVEACLEYDIPCPEIMHEKNEGCVANIIFLAEGFTEAEIPEFENLSQIAMEAIMEMEPFKSASENLNFYRVNSISATTGISSKAYTSTCNGTTGTDSFSDTPWAVYSNKLGLKRLLGMDREKRDSLEELFGNYAIGDYVYTIIIANTTGYFGGSEFPGVTEYNTIEDPKVSNMIVSKYKSGEIFKYLIRHEFGHSFGNLDDEYVDSLANCTLEEMQSYFLETPKLNVLTYNPGGWYEGARYLPTGTGGSGKIL